MVGFNRRFAKLLVGLREAWAGCGGPQVVNYTVNAGPLDAGSWYGQTDLHGSRFAGEGGHFIDTVSWWLGADPVTAQAVATPGAPDNLIALLTYPDGSVANIAYRHHGRREIPEGGPGGIRRRQGCPHGQLQAQRDLARRQMQEGARAVSTRARSTRSTLSSRR